MTPEHRKVICVGFVLERGCVCYLLYILCLVLLCSEMLSHLLSVCPSNFSSLVPLLQLNESGSIGHLLEKSSLIIIKDWLCIKLFSLINFNTARNVVAASSLADIDFPLISIFHSKLISNLCDSPINALGASVPLISGDPFLKFCIIFFWVKYIVINWIILQWLSILTNFWGVSAITLAVWDTTAKLAHFSSLFNISQDIRSYCTS